jgi:hypothetical protein
MSNYVGYYEAERIKELFVGKSIVKAEKNELTLNDGTILQIQPNDGCVCGAGDYWLENINKFDNVITDAEVKIFGGENGEWDDDPHTYQLFVYSGGISTSVADVIGDDGNGYYGTGFSIYIKHKPEPKIEKKEFINIFDSNNWEIEQ